MRSADGRRPVDVYARPWSGARGARVAIVVGGLGLSQTGTQQAIAKLPSEVTLAFAPQGNSIGRWMQAGRQKGHEILMQVPLEPFDYPNVNPGRNTLTLAATPEENIDNLHWTLSRTTNYTGIMNYMGARFVADPAAMSPVMAELGKRGLLYLDDGSTARSVAPELALKNGVPFAAGDAIIDGEQDRGADPEEARPARGDGPGQGLCRRHRLGFRRHRRCRDVLGRGGKEARHRDRAGLGRRRSIPRKAERLAKKHVDPETLPYRPCVGLMVLNAAGLVWVGHRIAEPDGEMAGSERLWQMPQGGIDKGEDPLEAARRELYEETGMRSVSLIAEAPDWINYDLPRHLVGIVWKGKYRGQTQKWFAFRFEGDESEIRINPPPGGHEAEFDRWDWRPMADLQDLVVPFKREVYDQVVAAFRHLA